nr:ribonuclease H-like domain-containing protein [Tanacetum cinerariifolium]
MYENFNAPSTESLDSIFNRLLKIVGQLAILGENISQEDLNMKFLRSLPAEWNTHVVVWRNKPDSEIMSFDDLYNNFKIIEQEVKRTVVSSSSSGSLNMAFLSSPSSNNEVNTDSIQVSAASTPVSTVSSPNNTSNLSDATVYAFLANQPNGSQLVHEDLEKIHEDDLEEMDLKWQLALLSIRARRYFQKTSKKISINWSDTAGYDKTKVERFNCHNIRHFARECRSLRNQESRPKNQDSSRKTVIVEDTSSKAMVAIDGAGFDWSYLRDDEVPTNMALMGFSDSEKTGQREVRPVWNHVMRVNHQNFSNSKRIFAPTAVLTKSGIVPISTTRQSSSRVAAPVSTARPINTDAPKPIVNIAKSRQNAFQKTHSLSRRPFHKQTTLKNRYLVNTAKVKSVNTVYTVKGKSMISAIGKQGSNAAKSPTCWVWRPKIKGDPQASLRDTRIFNNGCLRHMTGNKSFLSDYQEYDGGFVAFAESSKGGKITGKGKIRTGNLDFEDVYFVKELKFNLFSVSHMCAKKNSVLFTETECLILSLDFKLPDENQVLLKVPRKK